MPYSPLMSNRVTAFHLDDVFPKYSLHHRDHDSWPPDSFFVLPDAVLSMDAEAFRADLTTLDPVLSASLPDWPVVDNRKVGGQLSSIRETPSTQVEGSAANAEVERRTATSQLATLTTHTRRPPKLSQKAFSLLHNHQGLMLRSSGKGTVVIGGGGGAFGNERASSSSRGDTLASIVHSQTGAMSTSTTSSPASSVPQPPSSHPHPHPQPSSQSQHEACSSSSPSQSNLEANRKDRLSGLSYKEREERVRQLRLRQQEERHRKLEELKEQAASAQRFREQQETARRQRFEEMRNRDQERRQQVEERKKLIAQAEQERRSAVLRKNEEREQRIELKRRQESSNAVFAFGSSTPRMLDPKETVHRDSLSGRRSTSTSNVNASESSVSEAVKVNDSSDSDLSRKRAVSAHGLNRRNDDLRMSTSMYEVFNWDENDSSAQSGHHGTAPASAGEHSHSWTQRRQGDSSSHPFEVRSTTAARRRTDLMPTVPLSRDSPGEASPRLKFSLAPQHAPYSSAFSKSMSHIGPPRNKSTRSGGSGGGGVHSNATFRLLSSGSPLDRRTSRSSLALSKPKMTRSEMLKLSKLRATAVASTTDFKGSRSGNVTPSSRPTSSLSQASGTPSQQVAMRTKSAPKRPRPTSIAGSVLSSVDKPKEHPRPSPATASTPTSSSSPMGRSSRSWEKRLSSGSIDGSTPTRNKSFGGSDVAGAAGAKARTPNVRRTPAQVKAENAAKKASLNNGGPSKVRSPTKAISLGSSSPVAETNSSPLLAGKSEPVAVDHEEQQMQTSTKDEQQLLTIADQTQNQSSSLPVEENLKSEDASSVDPALNEQVPLTTDNTAKEPDDSDREKNDTANRTAEDADIISDEVMTVQNATPSEKPAVDVAPEVSVLLSEESKTAAPMTPADKAIQGYASEEDYKAVLSEKRRRAREAKERELELQRQQQLEEEERERREEQEYLLLMEEQKKAEEERLRQAIEEAEKQRKIDAVKKQEEDKLRIEAEEIERQKKEEAEERMKKEEQERQLRKSRVAAIMSRTRGSKGSASTPSKSDANTPSEEAKSLSNTLMSESMTENLINRLSNTSMTDSMIVEAIETESRFKEASGEAPEDVIIESPPLRPSASSADQSSTTNGHQTSSDGDGLPSLVNGNCQPPQNGSVDTNSNAASLFTDLDLISSIGVGGKSLNGAHNPPPADTLNNAGSINTNEVFDPFAPVTTPSSAVNVSSDAFDQIIDVPSSKLINDDVLNGTPDPIIAFEENLNRKSCDPTSTIPDFLL